MKGQPLPNAERAIVHEAKVTTYLLSDTHPDGRGKAGFLVAHGFSPRRWEILAEALRGHAMAHVVGATVQTAFGMRLVVEGPLVCPDGRAPNVRAVWFVRTGREVPELVTAYPMKWRS